MRSKKVSYAWSKSAPSSKPLKSIVLVNISPKDSTAAAMESSMSAVFWIVTPAPDRLGRMAATRSSDAKDSVRGVPRPAT